MRHEQFAGHDPSEEGRCWEDELGSEGSRHDPVIQKVAGVGVGGNAIEASALAMGSGVKPSTGPQGWRVVLSFRKNAAGFAKCFLGG